MSRPAAAVLFALIAGSRVQPSSGLSNSGFQPGDPLGAQHANWLWGALGDWMDWLTEPGEVTIDLGTSTIGAWTTENMERVDFGGGPDKIGMRPTAGAVIGRARLMIPLARVAGGGAVRLSHVDLNYRHIGAGSSVQVFVTEINPAPTAARANVGSATASPVTSGANPVAFRWSPDLLLLPGRSYEIGIALDRADASDTVEIFDLRAVISRPVAEG